MVISIKYLIIIVSLFNFLFAIEFNQPNIKVEDERLPKVTYNDSIIVNSIEKDTSVALVAEVNYRGEIIPISFVDSLDKNSKKVIQEQIEGKVLNETIKNSVTKISNRILVVVNLKKKSQEEFEDDYADLTIEVIGHKQKKIGSSILTKEKIDKTAGYLHETIKIVEMTKSATRGMTTDWREEAIRFRGAGAFDTKYYLDGIEMDKYYHMGGMVSAIPSDVITKMDILPSIAMSTVGNGTGGTINLVTADTVANHFSLGFGLQGIDVYTYANIPIVKEKASIYLFARRMIFQNYMHTVERYILNDIDWQREQGDDHYTDIFAMVNSKFSKNSSTKLLYSYSNDIFEWFEYYPKNLKNIEDKYPITKVDKNFNLLPVTDSVQNYIDSLDLEHEKVTSKLKSKLSRDELVVKDEMYIQQAQHLLSLSHRFKLNDLELNANISGHYTDYVFYDTRTPNDYDKYEKKRLDGAIFGNYQTKYFNHFLSLNAGISDTYDSVYIAPEDYVLDGGAMSYGGDAITGTYGGGMFNYDTKLVRTRLFLGRSIKKSASISYAPTYYVKNFEITPQVRLNAVDETIADSLYLFPEFRGQVVYNLPNKASVYVSGGQAKRVEDPHLYYKTGMVSSNQITVGIEELKFHKTDISFAGFYHQYKGVPEFRDTTLTYSGEDYTNLGIDSESYTYNIIDPFATETRSAGVELGLSTNLKKMFFDINSAYKHTYTYSNKYKKWLPDAIDERFNLKIMTNYQFNNRHSVSLSYLFTTGKPDYESLGSIFNSATANGVRMYEPDTLGLRLPNYHSLSVAYIYNLANLIKRRNFGFELSVRHLNALFAPQVEEGGVEQVPVVQLRLAWNFGVDE